MQLLATSDAADGFIALVVIFGVFVMPMLTWLAFRSMAHKERMRMIEQGYTPGGTAWHGGARPWSYAAPPPGPAAAPSAPHPGAMVPPRWKRDCADPMSQFRGSLTLIAVGLAVTVGLSFIGFGPWLIGGLVPLFIGLARAAALILSGVVVPAPGTPYMPPPQMGAPPPSPPPGAPNQSNRAAADFTASYTYRPGQTVELPPPSSPPERR